jgi:ABC-type transport system substrate-binding protein
VAQELGKIGIKIKYELTSMNVFMERMNKRDHQLSYWSWRIDYPDAENVFQLLYGKNLAPGQNYSNFENAEFDSLFKKLSYMQPSPTRTAIAAKMDAIVQEEVPWVLGIFVTSFVAVNGKLKNFSRHPFVMDTFRSARF